MLSKLIFSKLMHIQHTQNPLVDSYSYLFSIKHCTKSYDLKLKFEGGK